MGGKKLRYLTAGALAGLTNGFFGGGGGSVLVPLLTRYCGLEQRRAFATSVAVILPLCVLSPGRLQQPGDLLVVSLHGRTPPHSPPGSPRPSAPGP